MASQGASLQNYNNELVKCTSPHSRWATGPGSALRPHRMPQPSVVRLPEHRTWEGVVLVCMMCAEPWGVRLAFGCSGRVVLVADGARVAVPCSRLGRRSGSRARCVPALSHAFSRGVLRAGGWIYGCRRWKPGVASVSAHQEWRATCLEVLGCFPTIGGGSRALQRVTSNTARFRARVCRSLFSSSFSRGSSSLLGLWVMPAECVSWQALRT